MSSDDARPWSQYMLEVYFGRPQMALRSFYVDEVEKEAREKLKDYKGASLPAAGPRAPSRSPAARRVPVCLWERRELLS